MSRLKPIGDRSPGYRFLQALRDLFLGGEKRSSAFLRLGRPRGLFQPFGDTADDRYPEIFADLRDRLDGSDVAILSFGCSTGEEVFTLKRYFPAAVIKGLDISPRRIAICRSRLAGYSPHAREGINFEVAGTARDEQEERYDAALAMAVFRHGDLADGPPSSAGILDFQLFESEMSSLCRCIKPGGYLAIRHSNFRFSDTVASHAFEPVLAAENITPKYDTAGHRLPHDTDEPCLFRKRL